MADVVALEGVVVDVGAPTFFVVEVVVAGGRVALAPFAPRIVDVTGALRLALAPLWAVKAPSTVGAGPVQMSRVATSSPCGPPSMASEKLVSGTSGRPVNTFWSRPPASPELPPRTNGRTPPNSTPTPGSWPGRRIANTGPCTAVGSSGLSIVAVPSREAAGQAAAASWPAEQSVDIALTPEASDAGAIQQQAWVGREIGEGGGSGKS